MSPTTPRTPTDNPSALPLGTRLGEFELRSLLGVGGFGIVYLAFDHALEREVAVKEYMPASLAGRTETMHVSLRSQSDADTFALGLKSFVNEAKLLARFDHPSLLKVHRFWEANGTAYMAMPVMRGQTLKEVRAGMGHAPDEAWLREMLTPLLGAIEKLHSEGVYHRDIAPDNIQIGPQGLPVLLDFGAARRVIGDKSQTLTAILKPAYAPIEQYAEAGSVKQGPWTDIYALGATLHYLLLNRPPPPATTRAIHDEASGLSPSACPGCSESFLHTIDWMLAPRPIDRPQSVAALREVLEGHSAPPRRRAESAPEVSQWDRTVVLGSKVNAPAAAGGTPARAATTTDFGDLDEDRTRIVPQPAAAAAPASDAAVPAPAPHTAQNKAQNSTPERPVDPPQPALAPNAVAAASAGPRRWWPAAAGVGGVAIAVAAFAFWPRGTAVPGPEQAAPQPAAVEVAAPAPIAVTAAPPAVTAAPESAVTTVVVPGARPEPAPAAAITTAPVPGAKPPVTAEAAVRPSRPATALRAGPAPAPTVANVPAAEPSRAQASTPAVAAVVPPPASVAPPAEPPKQAAASGPEGVCEGRNPVSYFVCMERECLRSKFQAHNDCLKWRKEARREVN